MAAMPKPALPYDVRYGQAVMDLVARHCATWEVRGQLCRNIETMPLEDACGLACGLSDVQPG